MELLYNQYEISISYLHHEHIPRYSGNSFDDYYLFDLFHHEKFVVWVIKEIISLVKEEEFNYKRIIEIKTRSMIEKRRFSL
jgi:hypothetical protein